MSGLQAKKVKHKSKDSTPFIDFLKEECFEQPFAQSPKSDISKKKRVAERFIDFEKDVGYPLLNHDLLSKIDALGSALPEANREQCIRTVKIAVALAMQGKPYPNMSYIKCEDRYDETRVAYEAVPTSENAKALNAAYQNLRFRQKKLGLPLQPRDRLVSLAQSQSRPSQAKVIAPSPSKSRRAQSGSMIPR